MSCHLTRCVTLSESLSPGGVLHIKVVQWCVCLCTRTHVISPSTDWAHVARLCFMFFSLTPRLCDLIHEPLSSALGTNWLLVLCCDPVSCKEVPPPPGQCPTSRVPLSQGSLIPVCSAGLPSREGLESTLRWKLCHCVAHQEV